LERSARKRPGGHAVSAGLPCTCIAASPALLVLFAAALARASPVRRKCGGCALTRLREYRAATSPRSVSPPRGYAPNAPSGPGARGQAVTPCPPDSRACAWRLRRRCSWSSPPVFASRRLCASAVPWSHSAARSLIGAQTRPSPKGTVDRAGRNEADTKGGGGRPPLGPGLVEGLVGYPPHSWWGGSRVVTSSLSSTDEERSPW
jgi:hypothetical protein